MSKKSVVNSTKVQEPILKKGIKTEHMSIDEIDKKLLRILNWDARLSYREIARQTKLSTGTVIARLDKLKSHGVIKSYSANIDPKKLGYGMTAIIEVVAPKLNLMHALKEIVDLPNIYAIYRTTGDIDMIIISKFKSVEELEHFLSGLYTKIDIQRTETRIVLNTVKEDFRVII